MRAKTWCREFDEDGTVRIEIDKQMLDRIIKFMEKEIKDKVDDGDFFGAKELIDDLKTLVDVQVHVSND